VTGNNIRIFDERSLKMREEGNNKSFEGTNTPNS
jgi:hypothetical protein